MAFTDWDFYTTGFSSSSIGIDTGSVLVDAGSLRVVGSGAGVGTWAGHLDSNFTKGFTSGRIRTVFRSHSSGSGVVSFFLYFMASQLDITSGGSCYYVNCTHASSALQLRKTTSGGVPGSFTNLQTITGGTNGIAYSNSINPVAVEVTWFGGPVANAVFGGTRIQIRAMEGTTAFTHMGAAAVFVDTSSPLTTSVAEGIGGFSSNLGVGSVQDFVDETTIYERVLI